MEEDDDDDDDGDELFLISFPKCPFFSTIKRHAPNVTFH